MRSAVWTFVGLLMVSMRLTAQPAGRPSVREQDTLDQALVLASLQSAHLPIILTSELPATVSRRAAAWTVFDEMCEGQRIFVYTGSTPFQCAREGDPIYRQCLLKLASVIVHESWHLHHGMDEAAAYAAQLRFLQFIEASSFQQIRPAAAMEMTEIRRSRDRVLAEERRAAKAGGKSSSESTCQSTTIYASR